MTEGNGEPAGKDVATTTERVEGRARSVSNPGRIYMPGTHEVKDALRTVDFPASRDTIVEEARRTGADDSVLKALQAMPPVDYGNKEEVLRSAHTELG